MRKKYHRPKLYEVYRGNEFLFQGNSEICCKALGIKESHFFRLTTPSHHKKVGDSENALKAYKIIDRVANDVLCPVCKVKAKVVDVNYTDAHFTIHRRYDCPECLTQFKSTEKILFTSIPKYVRDKFIEDGVRP